MTQTSAPVPQPKAAGNIPPSASPAKPADPGKLPQTPGNPEEGEHYHFQPTFWQKKWVINGVPVATSVIFYVGLFILMVILAKAFGTVVFQKATQNQVVVPSSDLAVDTPPGNVQFTGMHNDPLHQAFQDTDPNHGSVKGFSNTAGPNLDPSLSGGGAGDNNDSVIAAGPSGGFGKGKTGQGAGTGDNSGSGEGDGGPLAMFGRPGGGGLGPNGPVFGHGGNALTIAFVCDASGSMMEKMEALKRELSKAIEGLHSFQKFSITFFQNETPTFIDTSLILATPENKRKAESFLADVSTNGSTDPIPGLDIAFHQHPQLVYLLTDGDFPDNAKVLAEIHKLNPGNKIKINTIAFTDSADHDVDFRKLLKQIADESGGSFKPVNEEDLN